MDGGLVAFISIAFAITGTYSVLKNEKLLKYRLFLYRLFWIEKFKGDNKIQKFLLFYARCAMIFYLFSLTTMLLMSICLAYWSQLILIGIGIVIFPLMYRLVMGVQLIIHHIR